MPLDPDCLFCTPSYIATRALLYEDELFYVQCDDFPIVKGHILIIPKEHVACIGAYSPEQLQAFDGLYQKFSGFIRGSFGALSSFEHGIYGQTIFHSHVHLLPFTGTARDIVPEPGNAYSSIAGWDDLASKLKQDGGYLYFKIGDDMLVANPELREPRFFRDRYAKALGNEGRRNWREVKQDPRLMQTVAGENEAVIDLWRRSLA